MIIMSSSYEPTSATGSPCRDARWSRPWPRAARGAAQPVPQLGLADRQGGRPL